MFFGSTHPAGHVGQISILDRQTDSETVLADEIHTDDAHRVALQQWTSSSSRSRRGQNGRLFVSDGLTETLGGPPGQWAVLVADLRGDSYAIMQKFAGDRGAKSWRVSHPHPVFSADGKRIYYNVNAGEHTQLHVAQRTS